MTQETWLLEVARLIADGHTVSFNVKGNSMNPFIADKRDGVALVGITDKPLKLGDVVLAQMTNGRAVLHRIISRNDHLLVLQGDGNLSITETITAEQVVGRVVSIRRKGHAYTVDSTVWRAYSRIWIWLKPFRRLLLAVIRKCGCL